ncbi:chromosome partitioning protein, ParB family [Anaerocolumna jejuensis DSM 15929]|uniref:Chromosome partitioning protein, ParB family n=1 Tax=Anaerocolumna jejuensis DSM 15929 TaxID=1121322 RepID=A0A1M7DTV9_9FIRM|nr:ParB/RepB/Spo0J family partition protein [Anaerocolumna jejuensis]SHL82896.1 chromosome partitioning protein, ParB family [Anaerocolumna jejuensis DSM 15929]
MAVSKKGLGKGLDSMIPDRMEKTKTDEVIKDKLDVSRETLIPINEIEPNKKQPRKHFDEDSLQELADSIKQHGVIQPLIVQKKDKYFEIIAGERRWRAAKLAGLKMVPVIVKNYSSQEIVEIALIENIQREDLNPIEEALAYQNLIKEFNLKQDEVAEKVSKSRTAITNTMRLLKLDSRVQQMLIDDMISGGHARALLAIEDEELQYQVAMRVFDGKLSVRETEKLVKKIIKEAEVAKEEVAISTENLAVYKDLEEKIKKIMGTKVSIKRKDNDNGRIEIEYYSVEELERILELFETIH